HYEEPSVDSNVPKISNPEYNKPKGCPLKRYKSSKKRVMFKMYRLHLKRVVIVRKKDIILGDANKKLIQLQKNKRGFSLADFA
ncbi:326_t:CDS:1, partial [Rhizophagus irregularis]